MNYWNVGDRVQRIDTGGLGTVQVAAVNGDDRVIEVVFDGDPDPFWMSYSSVCVAPEDVVLAQ